MALNIFCLLRSDRVSGGLAALKKLKLKEVLGKEVPSPTVHLKLDGQYQNYLRELSFLNSGENIPWRSIDIAINTPGCIKATSKQGTQLAIDIHAIVNSSVHVELRPEGLYYPQRSSLCCLPFDGPDPFQVHSVYYNLDVLGFHLPRRNCIWTVHEKQNIRYTRIDDKNHILEDRKVIIPQEVAQKLTFLSLIEKGAFLLVSAADWKYYPKPYNVHLLLDKKSFKLVHKVTIDNKDNKFVRKSHILKARGFTCFLVRNNELSVDLLALVRNRLHVVLANENIMKRNEITMVHSFVRGKYLCVAGKNERSVQGGETLMFSLR